LAQVLRRLPHVRDPALLVGTETRDDAAVYRPDRRARGQAIVFTTDFFSPVVDDPFDFGRIAAANALSDVYAMGGTPVLALNLLAYPAATLPATVVAKILEGGSAACGEAGVTIGGGHTIDDPEPKFGLAVIGWVDPKHVWRNVGARVGDELVLTKPLGAGVVTTAIKRGLAKPAEIRAATRGMATLNRDASDVLRRFGGAVHACTDITGFGLLGHLLEMLEGSKKGARLSYAKVPLLPGTQRLAALDAFAGGTRANLEHASKRLRVLVDDPHAALLLADAQTSGGLLAAVASKSAARIVGALAQRGVAAARIGTITRAPIRITVEP
jgi:selenide,water dikinase